MKALRLWYYRHIKLRKLFKEEKRLHQQLDVVYCGIQKRR